MCWVSWTTRMFDLNNFKQKTYLPLLLNTLSHLLIPECEPLGGKGSTHLGHPFFQQKGTKRAVPWPRGLFFQISSQHHYLSIKHCFITPCKTQFPFGLLIVLYSVSSTSELTTYISSLTTSISGEGAALSRQGHLRSLRPSQ